MRYLVLLFLLAACGSAEKKNIEFGRDEGGQGACATPSFFRENTPAINDIALLPKGAYRLVATEAFFREEGGELRAHYFEGQRGNEFVSRKICASAVPERMLLSIPFKGFGEIVIGDAMAYRPVTATVFAEKQSFSFSRSAPGAVVNGSISEVLSAWSNWTFYQLDNSEFELRLYNFETQDEIRIVKLLVLRFIFTPAIPAK